MEVILKLAQQIGRQLAKAPAVITLMDAQKKMSDDPSAQKLLNEYEQQTQKMSQLEHEGKTIEVDDKHKLQDLQTQVSSHDAVKAYLAAQVDYVALLRQVNQAVMGQIQPVAEKKPQADA